MRGSKTHLVQFRAEPQTAHRKRLRSVSFNEKLTMLSPPPPPPAPLLNYPHPNTASLALSHLVCTVQMTQSPHSHCPDLHPCKFELPSPQRWELRTSYRTTEGQFGCSTCAQFQYTAVRPIEYPRSTTQGSRMHQGCLTHNSNQNPQTRERWCPHCMDRYPEYPLTVQMHLRRMYSCIHVLSPSRRPIRDRDSIHVAIIDSPYPRVDIESVRRSKLITSEPSAHLLVVNSESGYTQ